MATQTNGNFQNFITFSRGTNATLFDSTGRLTFGPNNLLPYSEDFSQADWSKNATTVSTDTTTAPNGTTTADTLLATAGTNLSPRVGNTSTVLSANVLHTASIYVKPSTYTFFQIYINNQSSEWANFTLSGSGSTTANGSCVSSIQSVGSGWYRVSITYTPLATDRRPLFMLAASGTATRQQLWSPTGTEAVFIWGAQLEAVTYQTTPSEYIPTVASAVYRPRLDYDPVSLTLRGMLVEDQRTNLILQSQALETVWTKNQSSITTNAAIAPDGTQSADLWVATTSGNTGTTRLIQSAVVSPSTVYTASIYAKSFGRRWVYFAAPDASSSAYNCWFDLQNGIVGTKGASVTSATITNVGNGWYRLTTTSTATATPNYVFVTSTDADNSLTVTANGVDGLYIWGAQLEAGPFATSYIPTGASSVTRNADIASLTGANFTPWYNTEGTILAYADSSSEQGGGNTYNIFSLNDGTAANFFRGYVYLLNVGANVFANAASVSDTSVGTWTLGRQFRSVQAYRAGNIISSVSGGLSAAGTPAAIPVANTMTFGSNNFAGGSLNGHIRSLAYYPYRLTDAQIQALTTMPLEASMSLQFTPNSDSFVDASWGV